MGPNKMRMAEKANINVFSTHSLSRARSEIKQSRELFFLGVFLRRRLRADPEAAVLIAKALRLLFATLSSLFAEGPSPEQADLEELIRRVGELNQEHRLFRFPVDQQFGLIQQLAAAAVDNSIMDDPRQRKAFQELLRRIPGVYRDVEFYLRRQQRLKMGWTRRMAWPLAMISLVLGLTAALVILPRYRQRRCVMGKYYHGVDFAKLAFERRDCVIDHDWGNGPPGKGLGVDDFSVRWEGILEIKAAGNYTFGLESDDGSRLLVNNKLVIDHWSEHAFAAREGHIRLQPGSVPFRLEMYEHTQDAAIRFYWREKGKKRVVPRSMMHSP